MHAQLELSTLAFLSGWLAWLGGLMPILLAYRKIIILLSILASWSYASLALLPISHLGSIIYCLSLSGWSPLPDR